MLNKPSLKPQQVKTWLEDPVTLKLIEQITNSINNTKESLINEVLFTKDEDGLKQEAMGRLLGYKAQIQVLETIQDLEIFLETEEEELEDEIQTNDVQADSEDNED